MKIVFASYNTCCQNVTGGVQNRLRKIATLVEKRGLKTELFNPFETKLEKGDILHIFMLSIDVYNLVEFAKKRGVKVVISTIVPLIDKRKLHIYKIVSCLPFVTSYVFNKSTLISADVLITESRKEADYISRNFSINKSKFHVVPNGIDMNYHKGDDIFNLLGFKRKYVLQVGRFDENKNQLSVIKALRGSDIDVVFVGGAGDEKYLSKCKDEAIGYENIHFTGWLENDSVELKSAYINAEVVVLPSFFETFGLVAIEGASCGAKLVLSKTLPINDYNIFDGCEKIDPRNINDIREKILKSFHRPSNPKLKEDVCKFFSWENIIDNHIKIYESI